MGCGFLLLIWAHALCASLRRLKINTGALFSGGPSRPSGAAAGRTVCLCFPLSSPISPPSGHTWKPHAVSQIFVEPGIRINDATPPCVTALRGRFGNRRFHEQQMHQRHRRIWTCMCVCAKKKGETSKARTRQLAKSNAQISGGPSCLMTYSCRVSQHRCTPHNCIQPGRRKNRRRILLDGCFFRSAPDHNITSRISLDGKISYLFQNFFEPLFVMWLGLRSWQHSLVRGDWDWCGCMAPL